MTAGSKVNYVNVEALNALIQQASAKFMTEANVIEDEVISNIGSALYRCMKTKTYTIQGTSREGTLDISMDSYRPIAWSGWDSTGSGDSQAIQFQRFYFTDEDIFYYKTLESSASAGFTVTFLYIRVSV